MNIIETYQVIDNSQQQCIDDNCKNHYLAGMLGDVGKTVKVLIQPFMLEYTYLNNKHKHLFIIGLDESTGLRHLIIFHDTQQWY